ncbi:MAG: DUF4142 domain-containing protein [Chthoniobacterales bacterium]|nr:DUF4142 domain-containing protein [Chthoniobacterales bacterium]
MRRFPGGTAQRDRALAHRDRQDDKFEAAYVAAMVEGHTEALEMIDNKVLNTASNDALKNHLNETRGTVIQHLEMGKKLQPSLER